ncbi:unnamed protein product [Phytophthora fragariaefolia]|uniref:Unnamed protein product n=1 Tax=Phytophthora fragariaefolia TaxID=1490495 RepID=A0A9W6X1V1_9STRA|nr:unnamed protein product [Phytophthora fragariaefolia]
METWPRNELFPVRRGWDASADMLAGQALQRQDGLDITGLDGIQSFRTLNRLGEIIRPRTDRPKTSSPERPTPPLADAERTTASMLPVTTRAASAHAAAPRTRTPEVLQELVAQRLRLDRVRTAEDKERWIANLKRYRPTEKSTGKGRPTIRGESPGNIIATYPFLVIAMDHMPASHKENTELLVWVDLDTDFVIVKANASRSAQKVTEAYAEAVLRRFGASEAIRHDREPGFMADFFKAFNKPIDHRQRATLAYRPQANGAAERMVQTVSRAVKMCIADVGQRDWDEYAERPGIRSQVGTHVARPAPRGRAETAGTPYQLFPIVSISKLKPVLEFPTRPVMQMTVPADGRFDFDEELLPEDSWNAQDLEDVFEAEKPWTCAKDALRGTAAHDESST